MRNGAGKTTTMRILGFLRGLAGEGRTIFLSSHVLAESARARVLAAKVITAGLAIVLTVTVAVTTVRRDIT
jgi:ABC-type multidrug transport system ATPase subunit